MFSKLVQATGQSNSALQTPGILQSPAILSNEPISSSIQIPTTDLTTMTISDPNALSALTAMTGSYLLVVGILGLINLVLWLWALIDVIKRQFTKSSSKVIWILVIIFIPFGPLIYLIFGRKGGTIGNKDNQPTNQVQTPQDPFGQSLIPNTPHQDPFADSAPVAPQAFNEQNASVTSFNSNIQSSSHVEPQEAVSFAPSESISHNQIGSLTQNTPTPVSAPAPASPVFNSPVPSPRPVSAMPYVEPPKQPQVTPYVNPPSSNPTISANPSVNPVNPPTNPPVI